VQLIGETFSFPPSSHLRQLDKLLRLQALYPLTSSSNRRSEDAMLSENRPNESSDCPERPRQHRLRHLYFPSNQSIATFKSQSHMAQGLSGQPILMQEALNNVHRALGKSWDPQRERRRKSLFLIYLIRPSFKILLFTCAVPTAEGFSLD
jgi:hypothetical protein